MKLIGKTLGGCKLLELVGSGGMGKVYRAEQLSLGRIVAVKILAGRYSDDHEFQLRFIREAHSIARINHPNILQIYEAGEADGINFMVMEFVEGKTIAQLIKERGYIEWHEASGYIIQAAQGLQKAAEANIIHRDIKPDNLMLTKDGIIKISDFGLAKDFASELTQSSSIMGTPAYMSPEQCEGSELDTRSDIYSLGATFYRITTGMLPFSAPTAVAMMYKQKHEDPIAPKQYMPSIPQELSDFILKLLHKEPEERLQDMESVAVQLRNILETVKEVFTSESTMKFDKQSFSFDSASQQSPEGQLEKKLADLIERGQEYSKNGHPIAAYDCFQKALALKPQDNDIRKQLNSTKQESTVAFIDIGEKLLAEHPNLGELRRDLHQRIKVEPENVEVIEKLHAIDYLDNKKRTTTNKIRKLLADGNYSEAIRLWDELHPLLREKSLEQNINHLKESVLPAQELCAQALELMKDGKLEECLRVWQRATEVDSGNEQAQRNKADVEKRLARVKGLIRQAYNFEVNNQFDKAIESYSEVLGVMPGNETARKKLLSLLKNLAEQKEADGDNKEALSLWSQYLTFNPKEEHARERVKALQGAVDELKHNLGKITTYMRAGKYKAAMNSCEKVLELDPNHPSVRFQLKQARKNFFARRLLPIFTFLVIAAVLAILGPVFYRDYLINQADDLLAGKKLTEALTVLKKAADVPAFLGNTRKEIKPRVCRIELTLDFAEHEKLYANFVKNISDEKLHNSYFESFKKLKAKIEECKTYVPKLADDIKFSLSENNFNLLFAQKAWKKAFQAGQEYEHEADGRKANIAPDLNRKISALRDFFTAEKFKEKKQVKQAMAFYAEAISFAPEMDIAKKEFDKLEKLKLSCDKLLKDAKDAVVKGIEQDDDYTKAKEYWDKAIAFAEKLVEKKVHTIEAKKIIKETNWRLDAGEGMVLVIISSRLAIAVDRYEYPNKKGSIPKAVAFHEARQIAASLGKKLPSEDEWRMLFKDRDRFAWGDAFDASRVNCSVTNTSNDPVACGSLKSGASREGIFELCGNMAEWLDNGEGENAQEASAVGGSFISKDENEIQLLSVKYHSAILVSPNIGFRCIKVYK